MNPVGHGSTTTRLGIGQPKNNDYRPTPRLSSQDNCSGVVVVIDSQNTTETSARVAETQQWECDQARHRGVNPTSSMSRSQDNDNGVGVLVDALCSTGHAEQAHPSTPVDTRALFHRHHYRLQTMGRKLFQHCFWNHQ